MNPQPIKRNDVIEHVFFGLERIESIIGYTQNLRGAPFPQDSNDFCDGLEQVAKSIRIECDMIIRGIGGITVNYSLQAAKVTPVTVVGVTKYQGGIWHFPYRSGNQIAPNPLEMPPNWLRSAYTSLSTN